jgi:hypothetical protein
MTRIKSLMTADDWQRAEDEAGVVDPPDALCEDCPPVGYPTDETRCDECPRSFANRIERRAAQIYEAAFIHETETASWAAALEYQLSARVDACREQAKRELGL